ncbi:MAG TPA: DUF1549 and DUF1553 domain-containing protein [Planctomycetota bacterium]|nr:DUF1549 and DUF1553 domain-containing protein [Planctomycetota bacterium]
MARVSSIGVLLACIVLGGPVGAEEDGALALLVHPSAIELGDASRAHRLIAVVENSGGSRTDATEQATFSSSDESVARIGTLDGEGRPAVIAVGEGEAIITARVQGLEAEVPVRVGALDPDRAPRFVHDVLARVTRAGCNSGSCHGSQHGRGGFKLSLLGYEPDLDFVAIARAQNGRRIDRALPDQSLFLAKPLGLVPHEGGRRFEVESTAHEALRRWIASGAPPASSDDPAVDAIEVFPTEWVLDPGARAHFTATARLSSGMQEDVTGRALLETLDDGVATVDAAGRITAASPGETAIMVRYQGRAAVVRVVVPYRKLPGPLAYEPASFIDEIVARKWTKLGLEPSPLASDGEFLRRLFVSVIGTLPTADEVRVFLDDPDPKKREKAVDAILERPEYVDYQTLEWGDLLRIDRTTMDEKGMWSFHQWVRAALRENRPIDDMVAEVITAQGSTYTNGPANYFRVSRRPNELAETTAQVFLGIRLQCAQCHHHPFEEWSQEDYWGLAAYFARVGVKSSSEFGVYGREQVVFVRNGGDVRHPKNGRVLPPKPLGAEPADDDIDRRRALASWLTSDDNRHFARYFANRLWAQVMGRGIVEPIDDIRITNPPSNPELLEALADELVRVEFDQKAFLRTILKSRVFALSSLETEANDGDDVFFSHFPVVRLSAEVLHDAICAVTGVDERFQGVPAETRAIELPDTKFASYFLDTFGRPARAISCECERETRPNVAQALHLLNGEFIQKRVVDPKGRAAALASSDRSDDERIEELYLAAFARRPTSEERARAKEFLSTAAEKERKAAIEDLLWALLNSTEFLFQH